MFDAATKFIRTGLLALGLIVPAGMAQAQNLASLPRQGAAAQAVGEARPMAAWVAFCQRVPSECAVNPSEPATVPLSPRVWGAINTVNRRVNDTIQPVTDEEHWGIADRWDIPTDGRGDCEDFQLLKRKILAEQYGVPRRAMRMTVVIDREGEGHAVLIVRTDRGDFVLDNKTNAVRPWFETGYVYVKRESQDRIGWVSLGRATSPAVTANW